MTRTSINIIIYTFCFFMVSCGTSKLNVQKDSEASDEVYFEGTITYQLNYTPKTASPTKEQADEFFGGKQVYTIKGDKYKSEMNGKLKMSQYYLGNDTIFMTSAQSHELLWIDATKLNDEIQSVDLSKNVEIINGFNCDLLTITSKKGSLKYFFNSSFKINDEYYKNHLVGFWDVCTRETKSIMLKSILDTESEHIEIVATDIEYKIIDDTEFALPNYERKRFPIKF